jgi:hypothetical protein
MLDSYLMSMSRNSGEKVRAIDAEPRDVQPAVVDVEKLLMTSRG